MTNGTSGSWQMTPLGEQTEKIGGLGKVIDSFKMNLSFGDRSTFSLE